MCVCVCVCVCVCGVRKSFDASELSENFQVFFNVESVECLIFVYKDVC